MRKLTYEYVKKFIEENSECILLSKQYKKNSSNLKLKCKCGEIFETTFMKFKSRNKRQCNKCKKHFLWDIDSVKKYIEVDSKSNCKLLSTKYINKNEKLKIKCKCGNIFYKSFGMFKDKKQQQCPKCSNSINWDYDKVKHFVEIDSKSGCKLLSTKYINMRTKMEFECRCGEKFQTIFNSFKDQNKRQCNHCSKIISHGEMVIEQYLKEHHIAFKEQYSFNDCRHKKPLPFDFYLPKNNLAIEYDGEHHYKVSRYSKDKRKMEQKLKKIQLNDNIKSLYCKKHSIKLLRIPYTQFKYINKILGNAL
ncbi:hypothetical protein KYB31_09080 [Clostridium felsineum]|uniref:hypothetical protein n=1 Tax=Clostridium felsineum TaxID=36839 RepID=UPI00214D9009|nr:hypothetical protein [Clostridium felsineum]MCR3759141.1 hypothetical protein [Clostridium felsineum]